MNTGTPNKHGEIGLFQIVILILSVLVLGALVVDTVFKLPEQISSILQVLDTIVCLMLLLDFGLRFYKAESKLSFMKWGWIDLLASIPNLTILRWGRLVRILQIIRLIRALRATHKITTILFKNRFQSGVASVGLVFFLLIAFSSIGILICEQPDPKANIKTAGDAIWWSVATITTVGYGDKYPITDEGRIVAMILMISGIGLYGTLSGLAASVFIHKGKQSESQNKEILDELKRLHEKIDSLKRQ